MDIKKIEARSESLSTEKIALQKTIDSINSSIAEMTLKQRQSLARMREILEQENAIEMIKNI